MADESEEEDWPITKLAAARRSSRLRRSKTVSRAKLKLSKDQAASKEKENWSKFSKIEADTRTFQRSLARRVPMPDPLTGLVDLDEVPADVKRVKLVVSSRKQKYEYGSNVLETAAPLIEVDGISLEQASNRVSAKKRRRTLKSFEVQKLAEAAAIRWVELSCQCMTVSREFKSA